MRPDHSTRRHRSTTITTATRGDRIHRRSVACVAGVLLPLVCATPEAWSGDRITGRAFATRSEVIAPHGMVATSQPLATQIGVDILQAGGTAVDAAIAANAALGLMEPTGNGMGGDLFAIVWDAKTRKLYGYNGSGRSPASLTLAYLKAQGYDRMPSHGPLPITVPGCVDGWFALHGRFGKLPMKKLLAPAVGYARDGFPVSELIAYYWQRSVPVLQEFAGFRDTFMPGGRAPRKGEMFRNPRLASTLEILGKKGRDAFYKGELAKSMSSFLAANGAFLSTEDFAAHKGEWVEPVSTSYRGYTLWELPPNGQGIAALEMLNLLEGYDFSNIAFGSAEHIHLLVEAKKIAFADRAKYYADPSFAEIPVDELISKRYADARRAEIDPTRAARSVEAGNPALEAGETIYLCTADRWGNMVSLIQSNYRGMGTGLSPGLGFIFQDRGELFDLEEGRYNSYAPRKRPFHTIIPAFITLDGEPLLAFGVMGGAMQPQGHTQIVMNLVDFGMNLQEAGDAPRVRHSGSSQPTGEVMRDGGRVYLEGGFGLETERTLLGLGHRVLRSRGGYGGYQAIRWDRVNRVYIGASESRKDGAAAGY